MKYIKKKNKIIAIIFGEEFEDGTHPITDEKWPLQILSLKHPRGKVLVPHYHEPIKRITEGLMEALVVFSGVVKVTVYYNKKLVEVVKLRAGQGIMIVGGGMGIEILEGAKMMEFKNGPFAEDKVIF